MNMKKGFCLIFFGLLSLAVSGAEFDPAACPDLSVKIFPGNNQYIFADNSLSIIKYSIIYDIEKIKSCYAKSQIRIDQAVPGMKNKLCCSKLKK